VPFGGAVLSAVVVNHRSSHLVDACLRSLLAGSRPPDEIVVVDNEARRDRLPSHLPSTPPVRLIARSENPGYAASCNTGRRAARGSVLLFLNADVTVGGDCLARCHDVLTTDPTVAIVTPRLEREDGSLDHASHRGLPTPLSSFAYKLRLDRVLPWSRRVGRYRMAWLDPRTDHDVEACSGAFLMVRSAHLDAIGGWDERYRFYGEDLDLCLRMRERGRRVRYIGTARATHVKGAFSHLGTPDHRLDEDELDVKRWVRREIARSHRLFFDEHLGPESPPHVRAAVRAMLALQERRASRSGPASR
jgi:N-acetylglucosaminyl-diphospho-decaprenol L-rhamnosyltransferase